MMTKLATNSMHTWNFSVVRPIPPHWRAPVHPWVGFSTASYWETDCAALLKVWLCFWSCESAIRLVHWLRWLDSLKYHRRVLHFLSTEDLPKKKQYYWQQYLIIYPEISILTSIAIFSRLAVVTVHPFSPHCSAQCVRPVSDKYLHRVAQKYYDSPKFT